MPSYVSYGVSIASILEKDDLKIWRMHYNVLHLPYPYLRLTAGVGIQVHFAEVVGTGYQAVFVGACAGVHISAIRTLGPDTWKQEDSDDLVQDCSISIVLAIEILQSCTKVSIW